jgi:hypothetical protein
MRFSKSESPRSKEDRHPEMGANACCGAVQHRVSGLVPCKVVFGVQLATPLIDSPGNPPDNLVSR